MKILKVVLPLFPDLSQTRIHFWSSDWGTEWTPHITSASELLDIAVTAGRSSKGHHPFVIVEDGTQAFFAAVAWSGNWRIVIRAHDSHLIMEVEADDKSARVLTSHSTDEGEMGAMKNLISNFRELDQRGRPSLLVEWNSWWPYEDLDINEEVVLENAKVAASLGFEAVILDAGWFGPTDSQSNWHDVRGDWDQRNTIRFPHGLSHLSANVRELGLNFGIWLEVEALGKSAVLAESRPEFIAQRDGTSLGYVCLGNPVALTWATDITVALVDECRAAWIKMDFNVDPGQGCNRTDHGHSEADGLAQHVINLYRLLDKVKDSHPALIVENCSSGGLRWDLGMAAHVDLGFASDPDWPEHALSTFWASSLFFPVEKLFNWVDSEWRGEHIHQNFTAAHSLDSELEFALAISLLSGFGMSAKLSKFSPSKLALVSKYIALYKTTFRPRYQESAFIRHLSDQPQREELGCRTVAFAIEGDSFDPLLLIYQLPGAQRLSDVTYRHLNRKKKYRVRNVITDEVILERHVGDFHFANYLLDNTAILLAFEAI